MHASNFDVKIGAFSSLPGRSLVQSGVQAENSGERVCPPCDLRRRTLRSPSGDAGTTSKSGAIDRLGGERLMQCGDREARVRERCRFLTRADAGRMESVDHRVEHAAARITPSSGVERDRQLAIAVAVQRRDAGYELSDRAAGVHPRADNLID